MTSKNTPPDPKSGESGGSGSGDFKPMAVAALGIQFAAALVIFGYAGQYIDQRFNTAPFGLLCGVFLGGGGTFYLSYRRLMRTPGK